jgi:CRP-like cAMP-binding protein
MRDLDLFSTLNDAQLYKLAAETTEVRFAAGETLIVQGADSRECYVILEGTAEISAPNRGGVVDTVGVGEAVGEMALILGWERTATVRAI